MCFSAKASFTASVVLAAVGVLCVKQTTRKNQLWLATIPFLFAIQQVIEGFLWLHTDNLESFVQVSRFASPLYLFFALLVWPVWIPWSLLLLENINWRRAALVFLFTIGLLEGLWFLWQFRTASIDYIETTFSDNHIQYLLPFGDYENLWWIYLVPTLIPTFISSLRYMWLFGFLVALGLLLTLAFYEATFISVWCFFAAWLSAGLLFVLRENRQPKNI